jgi:hypothetical protein
MGVLIRGFCFKGIKMKFSCFGHLEIKPLFRKLTFKELWKSFKSDEINRKFKEELQSRVDNELLKLNNKC